MYITILPTHVRNVNVIRIIRKAELIESFRPVSVPHQRPYRSANFFSSRLAGLSANMLPGPSPMFLAEVFAKRDLGLALLRED
jgi:hypothetical protein